MNRKVTLRKILVGPLLLLLWVYQKGISPLLPPSCIYRPSCSEYSKQALLRHGLFKGLILTLWRLLRCQPFCQGGHDPVPDKVTLDFFKSRNHG